MEEEKEIRCDKCKGKIEMEMLKDRIISKNKAGNAVMERFFECPSCGAHYTVTVIDREMQLMIQKRRQLMQKINRILREGGSKERVQKLLATNAKLKEDLKSWADRMKGEYAEMIDSASAGRKEKRERE